MPAHAEALKAPALRARLNLLAKQVDGALEHAAAPRATCRLAAATLPVLLDEMVRSPPQLHARGRRAVGLVDESVDSTGTGRSTST
jgi:hypothetical protein